MSYLLKSGLLLDNNCCKFLDTVLKYIWLLSMSLTNSDKIWLKFTLPWASIASELKVQPDGVMFTVRARRKRTMILK